MKSSTGASTTDTIMHNSDAGLREAGVSINNEKQTEAVNNNSKYAIYSL